MSEVKHIKQPRKTVRHGLPEGSSYRVRVSGEAMAIIDQRVEDTGLPRWKIVDELLGVA